MMRIPSGTGNGTDAMTSDAVTLTLADPVVAGGITVAPSVTPALETRLSLNGAVTSGPTVQGGWWPRSRDATTELSGLIRALNTTLGTILRLGVDVDGFDEIPRRITVDRHAVGIGWFPDMRQQIIVRRARQDYFLLLVVPPEASEPAAAAALARAVSGPRAQRALEILADCGISLPTVNRVRLVTFPQDRS